VQVIERISSLGMEMESRYTDIMERYALLAKYKLKVGVHASRH